MPVGKFVVGKCVFGKFVCRKICRRKHCVGKFAVGKIVSENLPSEKLLSEKPPRPVQKGRRPVLKRVKVNWNIYVCVLINNFRLYQVLDIVQSCLSSCELIKKLLQSMCVIVTRITHIDCNNFQKSCTSIFRTRSIQLVRKIKPF